MIVPIVFVVLSTLFVFYLFKGVFVLMHYDFKKKGLNVNTIFTIFKIPIICLFLLILFIAFGIPLLEANGIK